MKSDLERTTCYQINSILELVDMESYMVIFGENADNVYVTDQMGNYILHMFKEPTSIEKVVEYSKKVFTKESFKESELLDYIGELKEKKIIVPLELGNNI